MKKGRSSRFRDSPEDYLRFYNARLDECQAQWNSAYCCFKTMEQGGIEWKQKADTLRNILNDASKHMERMGWLLQRDAEVEPIPHIEFRDMHIELLNVLHLLDGMTLYESNPFSDEARHILELSSVIDDKLIEHFIKYPTDMQKMDWRLFEQLIAELFDGFGFNVKIGQGTKDGGFDLMAVENPRIMQAKYLIQCKRYAANNRVGVVPVRALYGVVNKEVATKGIIVTTSGFTNSAKEYMRGIEQRLEGKEIDGIQEWLQYYRDLKNPNA